MTKNKASNPVGKYSGKWFYFVIIFIFATPLLLNLIAIVFGIYNYHEFETLGTLGDFVGGLMNPILSMFTLAGLILTILLQRSELSMTREELERSANALEAQSRSIAQQNFDSTFFEMLKMLNDIVNSIDLVNTESKIVTSGRDCFGVYYTRLNKIYREKSKSVTNPENYIKVSYDIFWKDAQTDLSHYYRFLYRFYKFVDESNFNVDFYSKIIRSQLSDQELLLLFYNCQTERGTKFREIAIKHKLFDNMPTIRLLDHTHAGLIDKAAFGDNPMTVPRDLRTHQYYQKDRPIQPTETV